MIDEKIQNLIKMYHERLISTIDAFGFANSETVFSFVSDNKKFVYSFIYDNERSVLTIEPGTTPKELKKIHGEYKEVEIELHIAKEI